MKTVTRTVFWLSDEALNWAVAKCEDVYCFDGTYAPSTNWAQGGPIIEREKIELAYRPRGNQNDLHGSRKPDWAAGIYNEKEYTTDHIRGGPTPLIAAMRCYVVSKLGDNIEIPEELDL
jgi:hypothetical protein